MALIAYVGTYSVGSESDGIYRFDYDVETGRLFNRTVVAETDNPSFLTVDPKRRLLVCVNETCDFDDHPTGALSSFKVTDDLGLEFCDQKPSEGRAPCYASYLGDSILVANYVEGTVARFRLTDSGTLGVLDVRSHDGTGPDVERQEAAHAHSITPFPNGRFALATDLGTDELIVYELAMGTLVQRMVVKETAGAGPRHVAFSNCGTRLFVLNELNATLSSYALDQESGKLERIESVSTLPNGWTGENLCADIHLSPDGRFVYCSNRGHESLAVFRFDTVTDSLECVQYIGCGGEHPRNFAISPDGRFLLCANQNTHNIVTFSIDPESGMLTPTGDRVSVSMPVCIQLVDGLAFL